MPPLAIYKVFSDIQETYRVSQWKKKIGPHITLLPPFEYTNTTALLVETIKKTALQHPSLPITTTSVDCFSNQQTTIYASVAPTDQLTFLADSLKSALRPQTTYTREDPESFRPHITLSNKLSSKQAQEQLPKIKKHPVNFHWLCQDFSLFILSDKEVWDEIQSFPL